MTFDYYSDKTRVSNSMVKDFVSYDKYGTRILTPELFHAKHIARTLGFEPTDAMIVGTIVDRYFAVGPEALDEYPVVSRRTGKDPKEITNSMSETVWTMIRAFESFRTFKEFVSLPDTVRGEGDACVLFGEFDTAHGKIKTKGKMDFINHRLRKIVDQKTTGKIDTWMSDLQFRGSPNVHAYYFRQLAYYRELARQDTVNNPEGILYDCALAVVDGDGKPLFVPVRHDILDAALEILKEDVNELSRFYAEGWQNLVVDPFGPLAHVDPVEEETL